MVSILKAGVAVLYAAAQTCNAPKHVHIKRPPTHHFEELPHSVQEPGSQSNRRERMLPRMSRYFSRTDRTKPSSISPLPDGSKYCVNAALSAGVIFFQPGSRLGMARSRCSSAG